MWSALANILAGEDGWSRALLVLVDSGLKGFALLTLAAAAAALMRRSSAAARHLVWTFALTGLILLPGLSVIMPKWQFPVLPQSAPALPKPAAPALDQQTALPPHPVLTSRPPQISKPADAIPNATNSTTLPNLSSEPARPFTLSPAAWLLIGWSALVLIVFAPLAIGLIYVHHLCRAAAPMQEPLWLALLMELFAALRLTRTVRLMRGPAEIMPMAAGIFRPAIILPHAADAWPAEKRRAVLLHELAHIKRLDCLTHALARLAVALHWFNPLAWLALRRMRIERERACDDLVLAAGELPSAYAGLLLELARTLRAGTLVGAAAITMARPSQLEGRLLGVLDATRNRRALTFQKILLTCLMLLAMLFPCGMIELKARIAEPAAASVVSNVRVSQRADGSRKVDVYYDLAGSAAMTIRLAFSTDDGATFSVAPDDALLSGDVGCGMTPGFGRHIIWDAAADHPGIYLSQCRARVSSAGSGAAGQTLILTLPGGIPLELLRIPAGSFQMGSPDTERSRDSDESPIHTVAIGYDFYVGKTEVTQAQWTAVMGNNPSYFRGNDTRPVEQASWNDITSAGGFMERLNRHLASSGQGGQLVRLPSEAEWKYACRAGTTTRFYFGDSLGCNDAAEDCAAGTLAGNRSDYIWYSFNCGTNAKDGHGTQPVGLKQPNAFGLFDMSGNLWEWCQDCYHDDYTSAPSDGSVWEDATGPDRVARGGACNHEARFSRSAHRWGSFPSLSNPLIGFRAASSNTLGEAISDAFVFETREDYVTPMPSLTGTSGVYDAKADFEAGWAAGTNPNGPWTYGWSTGLAGPLTLFTRHHVPAVVNNLKQMWDDPSYNINLTPSIARISGDDFDDGNAVFDAGALILHPGHSTGGPGIYTHVMWTAPQAGVYSLACTWFSQQNKLRVDVHILVNGAEVSSNIIKNGSTRVSFDFSDSFNLQAGDMIDFAAGPNGEYRLHPGNTGLDARIVLAQPGAAAN